MIFVPHSELIKEIHEFLIAIYEDSEDPILPGFTSEGMIQGSIDYATTDILFGLEIYPTVIHMAAALIKNFNEFHPFNDGCKRTSLLVTYYFLKWNGYEFNITDDTVDFVLRVSKMQVPFNEAFEWMKCRVRRTIRSRIRQFFMNLLYERFVTRQFFGLGFITRQLAFGTPPQFVTDAVNDYHQLRERGHDSE